MNKTKQISKWKKFLVRIGLGICIFLCVCILFLFIFIANPLERSYAEPLSSLLPNEITCAAYIPNPSAIEKNIYALLPWQQIQNLSSWKELQTTPQYQYIYSKIPWNDLQRIQDLLQNKYNGYGEKFLRKSLMQELACSIHVLPKTQTLEFVAMTRVSYIMKMIYGCLKFLPKQLGNVEITKENNFYQLKLPHYQLFFQQYRDVFIVTNSQYMMLQVQKGIFENQNPLSIPPVDKEHIYIVYQQSENNILNFHPDVHDFLEKNIKSIALDVSLAFHKIEVQVQASTKNNPKWLTEYFTDYFTFHDYPHGSYATAHASIPWQKLWKNENIVNLVQNNFGNTLDQIQNVTYQDDFIYNEILSHFHQETSIVINNTNFEKENIEVFDPYPCVSLLVRCQEPHQILGKIQNLEKRLLEENVNRHKNQEQITFLSVEEYAGQPILRIKFPDISGGAIRPGFGIIDDYLIFTSHIAFIKSMHDRKDDLEGGWEADPYYRNARKNVQGAALAYVDTRGFNKTLQNLDEKLTKWSKEYQETTRNRNLKKFLSHREKYTNFLKSFILRGITQVQKQDQTLNLQTSLHISLDQE